MTNPSGFSNLIISDHPLVQHKLSYLRQGTCEKAEFKATLRQIAWLIGYEITADLPVTTKAITTPVAPMAAPVLKQAPPVIIPILRAGLGMSEGLEDILPDSSVGHIGLYRDENTKLPVEYLVNLPANASEHVIVVDPMLATGNSIKYALDLLTARDIKTHNIKLMVLVAAPEGVALLEEAYPDVKIYAASLDEKLNDKAYIVPGLGDAGDRLFAT